PRAFHHAGRPWEADAALRFARKGPCFDRLDIRGRVDEPYVLPRRERPFVQVAGRQDALPHDVPAKARILGHRELVPVRQGQDEVIGVEGAHWLSEGTSTAGRSPQMTLMRSRCLQNGSTDYADYTDSQRARISVAGRRPACVKGAG